MPMLGFVLRPIGTKGMLVFNRLFLRTTANSAGISHDAVFIGYGLRYYSLIPSMFGFVCEFVKVSTGSVVQMVVVVA